MAESVQVACIRKRGNHHDPHNRIQGLGGIQSALRWYLPEEDVIIELKKPEVIRRWNFYVSVNNRSVLVIVANHNGRDYLKTEIDGYSPDNLLSLPECP